MKELTIDEYKMVLLDVLIQVDKICEEHQLKYAIAYGTLLGAVRHHGYIPWDDDVDIIMPRDDYDKLAHILNTENRAINFIRIEENNDTCFPFGKICAKNTTIKETNLLPIKGYGAYIDVFPMCRLPITGKWLDYKKWHKYVRLASYSKLEKIRKGSNPIITIARTVELWFSRVLSTERLVNKVNNDEKKIDAIMKAQGGDFQYGMLWDSGRFASDIFDNQKKVEFEGYYFNGTSDPDRVLRESYGDYMQLPPKEKQIPHHYIQCFMTEE